MTWSYRLALPGRRHGAHVGRALTQVLPTFSAGSSLRTPAALAELEANIAAARGASRGDLIRLHWFSHTHERARIRWPCTPGCFILPRQWACL